MRLKIKRKRRRRNQKPKNLQKDGTWWGYKKLFGMK